MEKDSFLLFFFFFLSDARTAFCAFPAFFTAFPDGWGGMVMIVQVKCDTN